MCILRSERREGGEVKVEEEKERGEEKKEKPLDERFVDLADNFEVSVQSSSLSTTKYIKQRKIKREKETWKLFFFLYMYIVVVIDLFLNRCILGGPKFST